MRYTVLALGLFFCLCSFSQSGPRKSLSFQQDFHDYGINILDGRLINFDTTLSQTFRVGFNYRAGNTLLLSTGVSNGFLWNERKETTSLTKNYALGFDATAMLLSNNGRIFKKDAPFSPYLSFGYQYYFMNKLKKAGIKASEVSLQYGLGFNLNLKKKLSFQAQSILSQQLGGTFNTHFIHRLGFTQVIDLGSEPSEGEPKSNNLVKDYDSDGVPDANDQCPTLSGSAAYFGCPAGYWDAQLKTIARLDSLEGLMLKLKNKMAGIESDLENLKSLKKSESNKSTETGKPKTIEPIVKETAKGDAQKPVVKKVVKDTVKAKGKYQADEKQKLSNLKTLEKVDSSNLSEIEIVKERTMAYYVVTISALNEHIAVNEAKKIKAKYPNVKVIAQPNGFYRTAILSGFDKKEALKLLEQVTENGTKQAWLAYY